MTTNRKLACTGNGCNIRQDCDRTRHAFTSGVGKINAPLHQRGPDCEWFISRVRVCQEEGVHYIGMWSEKERFRELGIDAERDIPPEAP